MRRRGDTRGGRTSLHLAMPPDAGYEALQSMLTGEYTEESAGARTIRQAGGKDRHSKVFTSRGPRDRRIRLSVATAIRFYDLQDRLGFEQPSKAVEWLLLHCQPSIKALPHLGSLHRPDTCISLSMPLARSSRRSPQQPPAFHLYQTQDLSAIISEKHSSIDFHTRYGYDTLLRDQVAQLPSLQHLSQKTEAFSLQTDSPTVLNMHPVAPARANGGIPEDIDPHQSSHWSSSAGSSSNPATSLTKKFSQKHLDKAGIAPQSYSPHSPLNISCTPLTYSSKKRRMHVSQCFSAVPDHSRSDNYGSFISDINTSATNSSILVSKDECSPTRPALERLLGAAAFYDDFSSSISSNSAPKSTAMYGTLMPPANQLPAVCNNVNPATNFASLCIKGNNAVRGNSLQGIQADMNSMEAVMGAAWFKPASAVDVNVLIERLAQFQSGRSDGAIMSSEVERAHLTTNVNADDYRRSGMSTMKILSPSESNNIISNDGIMPVIDAGTNTANNNLASAAAADYNGDSAQGFTRIQKHKPILSFEWALNNGLL